MTKNELKSWLIEEADYTEEEVNGFSSKDLVDAYLHWYGICGYTAGIIDVIKASGVLSDNNK